MTITSNHEASRDEGVATHELPPIALEMRWIAE
jgi:hypothetical protein